MMNKTSLKTPTPDRILEFWFACTKTKSSSQIAEEKSSLWWSKNKKVDQEITTRFSETCNIIAHGGFNEWQKTARGLLALILCTDQFPRNMYRNTPSAFAYDHIALSLAKKCIDQKFTQELKPIELVFVYMPFEHSEQLADQKQSVSLFKALFDTVSSAEAKLFKNYLNFAEQHLSIIQVFSRFPHRNKILGRESTKEELAFLEQKGSAF